MFLLVIRLLSTSVMVLLNSQADQVPANTHVALPSYPFGFDASHFPQAALSTLITLACVSVLYTAQPFRERSDNAVAVLGQALVYAWMFVLLLRVIRVGEGGPTVAGCFALVVATIGLFAFALHAIYSDLRKADTSAKDESASESNLEDEGSDDETTPGEPQRGGSSPQETEEIGVTVVSIEDERLAAPGNTKSPWELLGLCAAEPEMTRESPADTHGSEEVAVLLARLNAQTKLIQERDQEIARLAVGRRVVT